MCCAPDYVNADEHFREVTFKISGESTRYLVILGEKGVAGLEFVFGSVVSMRLAIAAGCGQANCIQGGHSVGIKLRCSPATSMLAPLSTVMEYI